MRVGGPLVLQFNYLYQQAMPSDQVKDACVPTQWFGPMAKTEYPQKTTLKTWWNQSQEGNQVLNDGVAAFNYQPPPCQHFRKFDRGFGESLFIGFAVLFTVVGSLFVLFKRIQIQAEIKEEAALEAAGLACVVEDEAISTEPSPMLTTVTPSPRPASDVFEVNELLDLADSRSASGRKRD